MTRHDALRELLRKYPATTTPKVIYPTADEKKIALRLPKWRLLKLVQR